MNHTTAWPSGCGGMAWRSSSARPTASSRAWPSCRSTTPSSWPTCPCAISEDVSFSDDQIAMLVRNTQQMGAGLVMLGGPESFWRRRMDGHGDGKGDAGRFPDPQRRGRPPRSLVLLMHASEIAQGNGIQKQIAREAIKSLGSQDFCGVMQWNGNEVWIYGQGPVEMGQHRNVLLRAVGGMIPGDMPYFEPAMLLAEQGFIGLQKQAVAVKHMIVLSDGDPWAPASDDRPDEGHGRDHLRRGRDRPWPGREPVPLGIAKAGGGKYYSVNNPSKALPRIFQTEARRVSRPLVYEPHVASP